MKKNKDIVLEYLQRNYNTELSNEYTTQQLSEELGTSRSNLSTLLNELTVENKVKNTNSRPVLYSLIIDDKGNNSDPFTELIGCDGSLSNSIKLAKAAIMYPKNGLSTIIIGQKR